MTGRIVVTGLGTVTSIGTGWPTFWENLLAGKSGIAEITSFDSSRYPCHRGGEVQDFDATRHVRNLDPSRLGRADVMLAGGSDAFSRITYTGFARLGAVAPEKVQPFDKNRKGMIPGEGAAMLVLEPLERALARGARIYAEVASYGLSCDAHHMTAAHPEGDGAARAMMMALNEAGLEPKDVSYVSAHGTGTPTNDRLETIAVKRVFGERASTVPISSAKSMLGHTMGAASAIESAVCALAVYHDRMPPTINFEEPDPECDLDCVPNKFREACVEVAMNNAYAFGGNNSTLLLKKCHS